MKAEEISIQITGVSIFGISIGQAPLLRDFEAAFRDEAVRNLAPLNARQLNICDAKGLSWLVDLRSGLVLWLDISLGNVIHRKQDDHDPAGVFKGKVRVGAYTVQGPFSFDTAEIIRRLDFPYLKMNMLPANRSIHAITVSFSENEVRSDANTSSVN